jgi:hypothetical protein
MPINAKVTGRVVAKQRFMLSSRRRSLHALLNVFGTLLTTLLTNFGVSENSRTKPKTSWINYVITTRAVLAKTYFKLNNKEC